MDSEILKECLDIVNHLGFNYNLFDVEERSRKAPIVLCRALIVFQLRQRGLSLNKCGDILNLDHASINHLEKHYKNNKQYGKIYLQMTKQLKAQSNIVKLKKEVESLNKRVIYLNSLIDKMEV